MFVSVSRDFKRKSSDIKAICLTKRLIIKEHEQFLKSFVGPSLMFLKLLLLLTLPFKLDIKVKILVLCFHLIL